MRVGYEGSPLLTGASWVFHESIVWIQPDLQTDRERNEKDVQNLYENSPLIHKALNSLLKERKRYNHPKNMREK